MAENGVKIDETPVLASAEYVIVMNDGTSGQFAISDLETLLAGAGVLATVAVTDGLNVRVTSLEGTVIAGRVPTAGGPVAAVATGSVIRSGEQTIDGVLTSASRVLLVGQTDSSENGIYVTATGAWSRATDMDSGAEVAKTYVFVEGGVSNALKLFYTGSSVTTIDSDDIVFTEAQNGNFLLDELDGKLSAESALSELMGAAPTARVNIGAASQEDLEGTDARTGGIEQASGLGAPGVFDVNGVELLGFDAQGRVVFVASPRVLEQIEAAIGGPILDDLAEVGGQLAATEVRTAGVAQGGSALPMLADALGRELLGFDRTSFDAVTRGLRGLGFRLASAGPAGAPSLLARNAELLGFDAQGRLLAQPSEGFANRVAAVARQKPHLHDIACWGDSLTQGAFGEGTTYPDILAGELGVDVFNGGVGGTRSESIAMRQGGRPLFLTITGNELPADTAEVPVTDYGAADIYNNQTAQTRSGTINGVRAVLTRYAVDGDPPSTDHYTLRRESAGSGPEPIPAGSRFVMDEALTYRDRTQIVWAGRNNIPRNRADLVSFRNDLLHTADWLAPRHGRHLVVSITSRGEAEGASGLADILEANRELREYFGDRFVDLQGYMSQRAIHDAGLTPTAQDETDMAGGFIPASLREPLGSSHFNPTGYTMIGAFMARQIRARGW